MTREPTVGGDYNNWGTILNAFLSVAHNADGTLQTITHTQSAEGTAVPLFSISPFSTGAPWVSGINSVQFNSTWDQLGVIGWNANAEWSAGVASTPSWYQAFEFQYNNGTVTATEWYLQYFSSTGAVSHRPIQIDADRTTATAYGGFVQFDLGNAPSAGFSNTFNIVAASSNVLTLSTTLLSTFTAIEMQGTTGQSGSNTLTMGNFSTAVDSQIIFNPPASNSAVLQWNQSNAGVWRIYQLGGDAHLYLRDLANSRMQVTYTGGASAAAATTEINSRVKIDSFGAFASGDKYVIADASGNLHLSSLGPAS